MIIRLKHLSHMKGDKMNEPFKIIMQDVTLSANMVKSIRRNAVATILVSANTILLLKRQIALESRVKELEIKVKRLNTQE